MAQCTPSPARSPPSLTVSLSADQLGVDVCFAGSSYTKNSSVMVTYSNIPGLQGERTKRLSTDSSGNLGTSSDPAIDRPAGSHGLYQFCTLEQMDGTTQVSITAKDIKSNFQAYTEVPASLWCDNSLGRSYNGGCH